MVRMRRLVGSAALIAVVGLLAACSEQPQSAAEFAGSVSNNVYRNDALEFEVPLPEGWHQPSAEAQREAMEVGADLMAGDDPATKSAVDAAMKRTGMLLILLEHPYGAPVAFNSSINFTGEYLGHQSAPRRKHTCYTQSSCFRSRTCLTS